MEWKVLSIEKSQIYLVLSSLFRNFAPAYGPIERQLKVTAAKHDLILVNVRDPREKDIPDVGMIEVENPETGEEVILDTSNRKVVESILAKQKERDELLEKQCRNMGVDLIQLIAGESVAQPVVKLFAQRSPNNSH